MHQFVPYFDEQHYIADAALSLGTKSHYKNNAIQSQRHAAPRDETGRNKAINGSSCPGVKAGALFILRDALPEAMSRLALWWILWERA
jgi:hypothetical protein